MTDYTHNTGASGIMMIRDLGWGLEFWLTSNNSTTWTDHLPWRWTVNGQTVNTTYNYPAGGGWRRLGAWTVTYSQNVTFYIGATGTSGFGGPTTFTVFINRATVPPAPGPVVLSSITATSMYAAFASNGDGGSTIYEWQIGYGTNPDVQTNFVSSSATTISGLTTGTTYYFWSRGRNAQGWGPWGIRTSATTLRVPDAPSAPAVTQIEQVSVAVDFTDNGNGGAAINGHEIGWALTSSAPTSTNAVVTRPMPVTGLTPGKLYYFFARAHNSVGWGPWSAATPAKTIAGARVKVGAVWKEAVPYVRVSGVWRVARPWARIAGNWREST